MKILIAEDDLVSRHILQANLKKWDHEVIACSDGLDAWEIMQKPDAPVFALLDWMMPKLDGIELCRRIRALPYGELAYIIILNGQNRKI